jgi:hypothetical protein
MHRPEAGYNFQDLIHVSRLVEKKNRDCCLTAEAAEARKRSHDASRPPRCDLLSTRILVSSRYSIWSLIEHYSSNKDKQHTILSLVRKLIERKI